MQYTATLQATQRETLLAALHSQEGADVTFLIGEEPTNYSVNRFLLSINSLRWHVGKQT